MKLLGFEIEGLELFASTQPISIDFINEKRVSENELEDGIVFPLSENLYQLNSLAFVGINASGKTTILRIVADIIEIYLLNQSLSHNMALIEHGKNQLNLVVKLLEGSTLYQIKSIIKITDTKAVFIEEQLYKKEVTKSRTRDDLLHVDDSMLWETRSETNNPYLKDVDSIFSAVLNKLAIPDDLLQNLLPLTNENRIENIPLHTPISFVKFLDASIQELRVVSEGSGLQNTYALRFVGDKDSRIVSETELNGLLSSGTIKGINMLIAIQKVFDTGGYLIIDELENHFNKTIVINLLGLFLSKNNHNGATLIFSTHYAEILDAISRTDSIYVMRKTDVVMVEKYSVLAQDKDRKDKKKSALLLSGTITSAPRYQDLMRVKQDLVKGKEAVKR